MDGYTSRTRLLDRDHVQHTTWWRDDHALSYRDAIAAWRDDDSFREAFIAALTATPFAAYRWETPGVANATIHRPFEHVCIDSPGLDRAPDRAAFADKFTTADAIAFANLGRDAVMVVPCPIAADSTYTHLGAFVRGAPMTQQHALWREVGTQMIARLGATPVWLSTAGAGVAWLHVRLDDRPKYYSYRPYA